MPGIHTRLSPEAWETGCKEDGRNVRTHVRGEHRRRLGLERTNWDQMTGPVFSIISWTDGQGSQHIIGFDGGGGLKEKAQIGAPVTVPDPTETHQEDVTLSGEVSYVLQYKSYTSGAYGWNDNGSDTIFLSVNGSTGASYLQQFGIQTHTGTLTLTNCGNGQLDISGTLAPTAFGSTDVTVTKECV